MGGDYYDFIELDDGRLAVLVGDASGHGMAAGLLMAIAKSCLEMAVDLDPRPVQVLHLLNRTLYRTGGRRAFMSLFYGLLDPTTGALEYASAGHPFPLLRRADGEIEELGKGGLPLGLRPKLELESNAVEIDPGDLLLLYSDGLPEAIDKNGNDFGYERMRTLLEKGGAAEEVHHRIRLALDRHLGTSEPEDDFSLVVLRRMVIPPPPPPIAARVLESAPPS